MYTAVAADRQEENGVPGSKTLAATEEFSDPKSVSLRWGTL